jgi:uncharacterized protein YgbK (DUF1537 family)
VRARIDALRGEGITLAIADAITDADLRTLAEACADMPLITAGSGVALGLPDAYAARGWLRPDASAAALPAVGGAAAVLAGSCSAATNIQVAHWRQSGRPAFRVDAMALGDGVPVASDALTWACERLAGGPVLIHATSTPDEVKAVQAALGVARSGELVETCLAQIASGLVAQDVRRLVVAGGETSGAVVQALGVRSLRIGATIDPGVPWTQADGRSLLLALKSGNFGGADFFARALAQVA